MRLTASLVLSTVGAVIACGAATLAHAEDPAPTTAAPPATPQSEAGTTANDVLGDLVVVAGGGRPLPKIGIVPSISADMEDVTIHSVVRLDLDLSGEFEVMPDSAAPDGLYLADTPVDTEAWEKKGAEAVVRVSAVPEGDTVRLVGQAYLPKSGAKAVLEKTWTADPKALRMSAHKMSDALIGALTGHAGSFASRMTFSAAFGAERRAMLVDADGHEAHAVSPEGQIAILPAFGDKGAVLYSASKNNGPYALHTSDGAAVSLPVAGSVYGLAFSADKKKVAVSIGVGATIKLFVGDDLASIHEAEGPSLALSPTFSPEGNVLVSGAGTTGQRIYVDGKPITPDGIFAHHPTVCNHPDGARVVFAAGPGKATDLYSVGLSGGGMVRLTQGQGQNSHPACSPDGRRIAFFSTRTTGDGPGLYVMRTDGLRPKRISALSGESLAWAMAP